MTDLVLHVKRKYFEQIAYGEKGEEYRLATPYWQRRLEGRNYERVIICLGYPKRGDASRRLVFKWRGAERKTIVHSHFGATPVDVYAVRLTPHAADASRR